MPPNIAFVASLLLIAIAFRLDGYRTQRASPATWIPTLWTLIQGSRMVSQWLPTNAGLQSLESYEEGSPLDRFIFVTLIALALVVLVRRRVRIAALIANNRWLFLF